MNLNRVYHSIEEGHVCMSDNFITFYDNTRHVTAIEKLTMNGLQNPNQKTDY